MSKTPEKDPIFSKSVQVITSTDARPYIYSKSVEVITSTDARPYIYSSSRPNGEKVIAFAYGSHPVSIYFSFTPAQAIDLASHLVELAESLSESETDCTPNHFCRGRMVHLPKTEECSNCGEAA
jgi:hypothetical protein